jgi:hypothetical protein
MLATAVNPLWHRLEKKEMRKRTVRRHDEKHEETLGELDEEMENKQMKKHEK